jgi:hypothetical protein
MYKGKANAGGSGHANPFGRPCVHAWDIVGLDFGRLAEE